MWTTPGSLVRESSPEMCARLPERAKTVRSVLRLFGWLQQRSHPLVRFRRAHPCTHPALATPQTQPRRACCSTGGGKGAQARVLPYLSFCATASGGALCEARSLRARPRVCASALVARVAAQAGCLPRCLALRRTRTRICVYTIIFSFAKVQRNETRRARHRDLPVQGGKRPGSRTCVDGARRARGRRANARERRREKGASRVRSPSGAAAAAPASVRVSCRGAEVAVPAPRRLLLSGGDARRTRNRKQQSVRRV